MMFRVDLFWTRRRTFHLIGWRLCICLYFHHRQTRYSSRFQNLPFVLHSPFSDSLFSAGIDVNRSKSIALLSCRENKLFLAQKNEKKASRKSKTDAINDPIYATFVGVSSIVTVSPKLQTFSSFAARGSRRLRFN